MNVVRLSLPACMAAVALVAALLLSGPVGVMSRLKPTGPQTRCSAGFFGAIRNRRAAAEQVSLAVVDFAEALAAELRAGRSPGSAVERAAAEISSPVLLAALDPVVAVVRVGGDPLLGLREASKLAGCQPLRFVAAAWSVGESSGAGLADAVDRIAEAGRLEVQHRAQISAELAGPRATAGLLAGLPIFGWLLGESLGAHPLTLLFGTGPGWILLLAGGTFEWVGLRWTAHLVRSAQRAA